MLTIHKKPFKVFTIDNAFSAAELSNLALYVHGELDKPQRTFTNSDFQNGKTVNKFISKFIFKKIKPFIPSESLNVIQTIMFARVHTGKFFGVHTDTGYDINSKYTVLLYLNDDFEGGSTSFYDDNLTEKLFEIKPVKGRILCFDIDLFHSGDIVTKGTKLWIGTELKIATNEQFDIPLVIEPCVLDALPHEVSTLSKMQCLSWLELV